MNQHRWLGVLLSQSEWKNIKRGTSHEKVHLYLRAAAKFNVNICFFCLSDINLTHLTVTANIKQKNRWTRKRISLPKVIHNRAIYTYGAPKNKLRRLEKAGVKVFNSWNGYNKLTIHRILEKGPHLRSFLPMTRTFTKRNIHYYLHHPSFFVKPGRGSVGKGIIKVQRISGDTWLVSQQNNKKSKKQHVVGTQLYYFLSRQIGKRRYLLQKTIPLMTYKSAPFDVRVSVQKNARGTWGITGMVGKVAPKGLYLSNIYQGGKTVKLDELLRRSNLNNYTLKHKLSKVSLNIIRHLERFLPNLADVGFDLGIDVKGNPYFIEMNGRDQRYSFLLAGMTNTFRLTYENPVGYGSLLLRRKLGSSRR